MPNPITNFFRKNFGFSRSEINGLFLFIPLTVFILFVPQILKFYLSKNDLDDSRDQEILQQWRTEMLAKVAVDSLPSQKIIARHFNPNKLTAQEWVQLGFKEKIATRIMNYRQKGGQFRKKEDVSKIYGINQRLVKDYEGYMVIPSPKRREVTLTTPVTTYKPKPKKEFVKIDLNLADTTQFMTINGIGPYWSKRIVKYRTALGGFQNQNQLYEMYGMDESLADLVISHSTLGSSALTQVNVNQDSIKALALHPYISYRTAKAIVNYKKQHGDYTSVEALKKIVSISDSVFQKIYPYLKVSE